MEFSTTEEKRVSTYSALEYTVISLNGPCLVCETPIEYAYGWPRDEEHARKQFTNPRRSQLLKRLREDDLNNPAPKVGTVERMVCPSCKDECRQQREATHRRKRIEKQAQEEKVEARRVACMAHYEWRTAAAEEVNQIPPQSLEFRAVFANFELHEILFRWRAIPGKARANSYLMKIGMWVDGKLVAHYYGWNLQHFDEKSRDEMFYTSENDWPTEDLFGLGFCRWIERAFQPQLLRLNPDHSWRPGQYGELQTELSRFRPGTVRIKWLDGSSYVHILPSKNLPLVAEWAAKHLELSIEERSFRPVRRAGD